MPRVVLIAESLQHADRAHHNSKAAVQAAPTTSCALGSAVPPPAALARAATGASPAARVLCRGLGVARISRFADAAGLRAAQVAAGEAGGWVAALERVRRGIGGGASSPKREQTKRVPSAVEQWAHALLLKHFPAHTRIPPGGAMFLRRRPAARAQPLHRDRCNGSGQGVSMILSLSPRYALVVAGEPAAPPGAPLALAVGAAQVTTLSLAPGCAVVMREFSCHAGGCGGGAGGTSLFLHATTAASRAPTPGDVAVVQVVGGKRKRKRC